MNQFVLRNRTARELALFPQIDEIGIVKNTAIRLGGFPCVSDGSLKIYYIQEGKFEWKLCSHVYQLFPGDAAVVMPGMDIGNPDGVLEIGTFSWIHLSPAALDCTGIAHRVWSGISNDEMESISKVLYTDHAPVLQKCSEAGELLKWVQKELFDHDIGYQSRINHLLDDMLIQVARQFTRFSNPGRNFPKTFMELEKALRQDLSRQWTVEEMSALVGMGTTLFNEKVKGYSGFTPLSYLINIRISEAIKQLKDPAVSLTDIALDTGFYSSQHFSTTFKKLTGYTPSQFRKNHSRTK
ncbi:MAG: AraC family transcriptional regulator [Chitinophagaceae bacterium]|nr:MAG: AraC family transcriptional regulator [Chitinophagaceae bacterium]